jgi:hypothetical protein
MSKPESVLSAGLDFTSAAGAFLRHSVTGTNSNTRPYLPAAATSPFRSALRTVSSFAASSADR